MQIHRLLSTVAISAALRLAAGCAVPPHGGGGMGMDTGADHGAMPMGRMCEMHREMTAGKSPAAVEVHIRSMHGSSGPDVVAHHMKTMEMHCPAARP